MRDLTALKSYEALEETIRRNTSDVAAALHQSPNLVRRWKEPPATEEDFTQSGARNPLDRLEIIIETMRGIDPSRADLPIEWLNLRFGYVPPVKVPPVDVTMENAITAYLAWHKKLGESLTEVSKALADGVVTKKELKDCHRSMMSAEQKMIELLHVMMRAAHER